jgi:hypothetical protein
MMMWKQQWPSIENSSSRVVRVNGVKFRVLSGNRRSVVRKMFTNVPPFIAAYSVIRWLNEEMERIRKGMVLS